jgi:hypothetical protein
MSCCPHRLQNLALGAFGVAHAGQATSSRAPQSWQKTASAGFSC